ncbi:MAG: hypothetical protein HY369_00180 [Candidatus Aenigmarchaeota archaeon]|nr:hypothetical protein [Candidatus Aenigmarchaeota archaeon]
MSGTPGPKGREEALLKIRDAEQKAKEVVEEALARKEAIIKKAQDQAVAYERDELQKVVAEQQATLEEARQAAPKAPKPARLKARTDTAVDLVWKAFES